MIDWTKSRIAADALRRARARSGGAAGLGRRARVAGLSVLAAAALAAAPGALAQSGPPASSSLPGSAASKPNRAGMVRYRPDRFAGKAGRYYRLIWGVDALSVKLVESGQLVRFGWRVVEPEKAQVLGDRKLEPALVDPQAGVSLVVPAMEKIGSLRQLSTPELGKSYWMTFSNKGRRVKRGDRVTVVVGPFRAEGLVVD
jgi:hypothetical protein